MDLHSHTDGYSATELNFSAGKLQDIKFLDNTYISNGNCEGHIQKQYFSALQVH